MSDTMIVREFRPEDRDQVVVLWNDVLPSNSPWNDPQDVIRRKLLACDGLFFVGELDDSVIATVMAGYDGIRGWIYALAVRDEFQGRGFGRRILQFAEQELRSRGCPKINLQVRSGNEQVAEFYRRLGYDVEDRLSFGKVLEPADPYMDRDSNRTASVDDAGCSIRSMNGTDFDAAASLWQRTTGVGLNDADTPDRTAAYLARNPGLSFVAEHRGAIVGAVLCGEDGRRGYLHHLAVDSRHRKCGIGRALVDACLAGLASRGIDRCNIFLYPDNSTGREFWTKHGWVERDWNVLSRETSDAGTRAD